MWNIVVHLFAYDPKNPLIFSQGVFWLFFALVLLVNQIIYKRIPIRNLFLLAFSLFFYYKSSGFFFFLLLFSSIVDFYISKWIFNSSQQSVKKLLLWLSVIINLGLLGYFKYTFFIADTINQLSGLKLSPYDYLSAFANNWFGTSFQIEKIFLPVGISFYTFQTMSYTIDVYRGKLTPLKSLPDFAFFVSFFPQLVAGPIVRASEFIDQINKPYQLNRVQFGTAVWLILQGLVKKAMISDYISVNFVDRVFDQPLSYGWLENLMAVYGYGIQIYCDFSGYSDMANGIATLLGFTLPINFLSPYKADSLTDFWRRWHISLSTWLRDYLYIPLGGNRKGRVRTYINLLLTMLLGGLWHGAHVRFIIWGAIHGTGLALHKLFTEVTGNKKWHWSMRFLGGIFTFHIVMLCWIYFRAANIDTVKQMFTQLSSFINQADLFTLITSYKWAWGIIIFGYLLHWLPTKLKLNSKELFTKLNPALQVAISVLVVLIVYQAKTGATQPFIYFQF